MKNTIFKGAGVALVTPMKDDFSINFDKLEELVEFQIAGHTDAIIVCGTTGEASTLSRAEHLEAVKHVIEVTNKRVPVIAGSGSNDTAFAIETSRRAKELGADGLLCVTPYYNKTSQAGLIAHYTKLANEVKAPIILYNVPSRTGTAFQCQTYKALADNPYIVGIKEANANLGMMAETISLCGDKLDIYSGNDDEVVPCLSLGGSGVISVLSNVAPKAVHDLCYSYFNGDVNTAKDIQLKYIALIRALFSDVNPIPAKEALNIMGFDVGECRLPLVRMSESARENLKEQLKAVNLI